MEWLSEILALPSVDLDENRELPERSGVYFAIVDARRIAYVGVTWSFRQRWRAHNKRTALEKLGSIRVHYLEAAEDIMCAIEQDVIDLFQPCLNQAPAICGVRLDAGQHLPRALGRPRKPADLADS
jgi:hypothetical protein